MTTDRGQSGREMSAFWWTYSAPIGPLTPHHAHAIMQMHLECRVEDCARKSAAFRAWSRRAGSSRTPGAVPRSPHPGAQ